MADWRPDRLLKGLLIWSALTMLTVWLPLVRGLMDGESYEWGGVYFLIPLRGAGLGGHYWALALVAVYCLALLWTGWRGARRPFHWLLLGWLAPMGAGATMASIRAPEDFRFRGDTLGVDISLAWAGPVFLGGAALLAGWWVWRDLRAKRQRTPPPWRRRNVAFAALAAAIVVPQFPLLQLGDPHGLTDKIGVILTMAQWVAINLALYPWAAPQPAEASPE